MPEIKFTERWNEQLACYKETAKIIDGESIQVRFHTFLGCETNKIVLKNDERIRRGSGADGQFVTPGTGPHRIVFMGIKCRGQI